MLRPTAWVKSGSWGSGKGIAISRMVYVLGNPKKTKTKIWNGCCKPELGKARLISTRGKNIRQQKLGKIQKKPPEDVGKGIANFTDSQSLAFYRDGIHQLPNRWQTCMNSDEDYFAD